jgi:hypothetical protein
MSTYDKIAWLPLCGGLTGLGLVLSYLMMRRRGVGSGLRWAAWSLLPLAAYLTGSIEMFWKMGVAIGDFATGFVFSTRVWSGIAVAGVAFVLFVVSGGARRRRVKRGDGGAKATGAASPAAAVSPTTALATATAAATQPVAQRGKPAKAAKPAKNAAAADGGVDSDVEDILRRHGIS